MAGKLTQNQINALPPGTRAADGGNLYIQVSKNGTKSWIFRYQIDGSRRMMGLGSYPTISASKARILRDEYQRKVRLGIDPLSEKAQRKLERTESELELRVSR